MTLNHYLIGAAVYFVYSVWGLRRVAREVQRRGRKVTPGVLAPMIIVVGVMVPVWPLALAFNLVYWFASGTRPWDSMEGIELPGDGMDGGA